MSQYKKGSYERTNKDTKNNVLLSRTNRNIFKDTRVFTFEKQVLFTLSAFLLTLSLFINPVTTSPTINHRNQTASRYDLKNLLSGILNRRHPTISQPIKISRVKPKPAMNPLPSGINDPPPFATPPSDPNHNNPFAAFGHEVSFRPFFPLPHGYSQRTYLFNPSNLESFKVGDVRLGGSFLRYMGRVQVALPERRWGSICGVGWDMRDATVICRQLGFSVGGVIARPRSEFGQAFGNVVMSRVRCRGYEKSIDECPFDRWDGRNPLPCPRGLSAAGVVCGCPLSVPRNVKSKCFLYTNHGLDTLYCRYSCPSNLVLFGDRRRSCGKDQKWTGIMPQCLSVSSDVPRPKCQILAGKRVPCFRQNRVRSFSIRRDLSPEKCISYGCCYNRTASPQSARCFLPVDSPCMVNPCKNGGECQDYYRGNNTFHCLCPEPYAGKNCEFVRDWACGRQTLNPDLRPVRPQLRIVGGRLARRGSWPWIVQLRDNDTHFCSGVLVAPQWVITAAHCLKIQGMKLGTNNSTRWTVVVGQHGRVGHDITSQTINIEYAAGGNYTYVDIPRRDIALLKLKEPIMMSNVTSSICLPASINEGPLPGSKCWIAGWGTIYRSEHYPRSLQQGDIPIWSNTRCKNNINKRENVYSKIAADMLCAGYEAGGVDACKGDSGGPLMCRRSDGSWYIAGIVSWGYKCAEPSTPGVYTRVAHYLDWIYDVLKRV